MKTIKANSKIGDKLNFLPKLTLLVLSVFFFSLPNLNFGQTPSCNYIIANGSDCDIEVTVAYHDGGGLCHTVSGLSVLAHSQNNTNCSSCGTLTNVVVTCVKISGNPTVAPNSVDINSTAPLNFTNSCGTGGIDMEWHPNSTDFSNN